MHWVFRDGQLKRSLAAAAVCGALLAGAAAGASAATLPASPPEVGCAPRSLDDAFVDTFFLSDVEPVRAQMPWNFGDLETNLLVHTRVDGLDAVASGAPYSTFEELLAAFYANQAAFNDDPSRNRIDMHGSVRECVEPDGTVVVFANIVYRDLPLAVYTLDSWDAMFGTLDPSQVVEVLVDGTMSGHLRVEMVISTSGAPLHFWDSYDAGGVRSSYFSGRGEARLVDEGGQPAELRRVRVKDSCEGVEACDTTITISPLGGQ